jgi:hypothetical protein
MIVLMDERSPKGAPSDSSMPPPATPVPTEPAPERDAFMEALARNPQFKLVRGSGQGDRRAEPCAGQAVIAPKGSTTFSARRAADGASLRLCEHRRA